MLKTMFKNFVSLEKKKRRRYVCITSDLFVQVWSRVLLLVWGGVSGRAADVPVCVLG